MRITMLGVLLLRARRDTNEPSAKVIHSWVIPLAALALLLLGMSLVRDDQIGVVSGYTMVLSVLASWVIAHRRVLHRHILMGFAVGATISGLVVVLQALGLPNPAASSGDIMRKPGLASTTVYMGDALAIAAVICCVLVVNRENKGSRRWLAFVGLAVSTAGLVLSGGRGGMAAAGLGLAALAVGPRTLRPAHVVVGGLLLGAGLWMASRVGVELYTIARFSGGTIGGSSTYVGGITNGRLEVNIESLRVIAAHSVFGPGISNFYASYGLTAHTTPLFFALGTGVVGGLLALVLLARLVVLLLRRPLMCGPQMATGYGIVVALATLALMEPNAPFIGMMYLPVLMISVMALQSAPSPEEESASGTKSESGYLYADHRLRTGN